MSRPLEHSSLSWTGKGVLAALTGGAVMLSVFPGDCPVRPSPHRPPETLPAPLPVFQRPSPGQSPVSHTHRRLLQQRAEQADSGAGDELRAAGRLHSGTPSARGLRAAVV